jgi:hypothetical protein
MKCVRESGLFHILWTLVSGRLLQSRGAIIPALAATGLEPATVRRAWAAFAHGAWDISQLVAGLWTVVQQDGRWHAQHVGGYRVVAVNTTGFFRPRPKNCATKHFLSQAGEALPAIPFGLTPCPTRRVRVASVGTIGFQTVPLVRQVMRAPSPTATEAEMVSAVLAQTATQLAPDEAAVVDRGFTLGKLCTAGVARWVSRVPRNFTARRSVPAAYCGKGRRPSRGALVRPLARTRKGHTLAATPPDRTETLLVAGRSVQADIWSGLCLPQAQASPASFQCVVVRDPAYAEPWVLATNLPLAAADVLAFYHERWPVEQVPLTAKQLLGAQRQFVFADAARQRLPELALLASSLLTCT